ncbi:MAG TPA: Gmad2 immunoglobulin-like domain-containing protein [Solirubrobacteraceae bacterium]|nr:Gmad2 immunoglobulin-like domain-containing protein [Solirubrobacteraceae bacterium]
MTVRSALLRLLPIAALLAAVLSLAACGDDDGGGSAPEQTRSAPAPADARYDGALWPDPAVATADATPADVARSFVEDFVGMPKPALGEFQQGDSRSGEIPMLLVGEDRRPREDRVLATIALRQLDGRRWFVIAAIAEQARIERPRALEEISSPLRVAGEGAGFEGNLVVSLRAAFRRDPLAQDATPAGNMQAKPFSATLAFERPQTATGAVVVRDGGGLDGVPSAFSAIPVQFAAG